MTSPDRFEVSRHFDAELAERYERRIRMFCPSYDALHEMIGTLLNRLPKDASILSAGAGTGAEVIRLGTRFPSWRFVAADISPDMLHVCRERVEGECMSGRVEYFHGCLRDYRPQLPFDAATSIFVSHFILSPEERQAHFQAIADSLKPGGLLVFGDLYGDRHSLTSLICSHHGWMGMRRTGSQRWNSIKTASISNATSHSPRKVNCSTSLRGPASQGPSASIKRFCLVPGWDSNSKPGRPCANDRSLGKVCISPTHIDLLCG